MSERDERLREEQTEKDDLVAPLRFKHVDHDINADMDAGAHAVGGAELRHPHEHVDAELLRPGEIDVVEKRIKKRDAKRVALHHRNKDHQRRPPDQGGDQNFLKPVENT